MNTENLIRTAVAEHMGGCTICVEPVGKGASGSVYRVECSNFPSAVAVKVSTHPELMQREYRMLSLLKERTASRIPELYFFHRTEDMALLAMEYIEGVSGAEEALLSRPGREHLAESIIDNLLLIQRARNDKFGPWDHAVYDSWQEYYREFADAMFAFAREKHAAGQLEEPVMEAVRLSHSCFDTIFSEEIPAPTLIHGDYWMPNFLIDPNSMELLAAVDPFNVMWADPEYELFALTVGAGAELGLLDIYKRKVPVSYYCDVKIAVYALYSELLWYKNQVPVSREFLDWLARRVLAQMKNRELA